MIGKELIDWIEGFMSYIPGKIGTFTRMCWYRYRWKKPKNVRIRTFSEFIHPQNILFHGGASLGKLAFFSAEGGEIEIGENFSCNVNCHINASVGGKIKIGNGVLIGPNTMLRTANHKFDESNDEIQNQGHTYDDIIIEDNVWIGANCVILNGVRIGKAAVIAAGAVVNKDVQSFTLVGGVPAKLLKRKTK